MRYFNTAGPVRCDEHYCLPPLQRLDLEEVLMLIDQKKYFVLHAPRQTGKTSCLLALMEYLNSQGKYKALYINVEKAQAAREDVSQGIKTIVSSLQRMEEFFWGTNFLYDWQKILEERGPHDGLETAISLLCQRAKKPVVLMIDEIDSLIGDTLISVLRQIRSGYAFRPKGFPQSIILCGVRDVRDYRIHASQEKEIITGGSAFNIKAESLHLGDFNKREISILYSQHTEETGQEFEDGVIDYVWELTEGQPWLVNALGYVACFKIKQSRDRSKKVTKDIIEQAKEKIIIERYTHIDQLADKLREERVKKVIECILMGEEEPEDIPVDDILYVRDLGLIKTHPSLRISNKIYQEVIPRELTFSTQLTITQDAAWYVREDGSLDMDKLMRAFQEFFREHSESWIERFDYKEAGPQLLMQAFLQRIVNSGGRIYREYGLGRRRTDLLVVWPTKDNNVQKIVIELKILRKSLDKTIAQGLKQTKDYMDKCSALEGHLVIFDKREDISWDEKIFEMEKTVDGKKIKVWGM
ncbi:AAA-like domain-containing protein [Desulfothermus sp.]